MNPEFDREAQEAVKKMSWWQKLRAIWGKKIYLGHEQREGWSGPNPFYLFWCDACKHFAKDYPHNTLPNRRLDCSFCDARHDFNPWWLGWAMLWGCIKILWKYRNFRRA